MINEEKNQRIEIDEKPLNPRRIEEKNRSTEMETGYNIFALLFWALVATAQLRFCLVVLVSGTTSS